MHGSQLLRVFPLALCACGVLIASYGSSRLGPLDLWAMDSLPVLCPWRRLSGWSCPSCGLGRSLLAVWSGDWQGALHWHFLGPAIAVALWGVSLLWLVRPALVGVLLREARAWFARRPWLAALLILGYVAWGIMRAALPA